MADQPTKPKKQMRLEDLTPEARAVIASRQIAGSYNVKNLVKLLDELAAFDAGTDEAVSKASSRMVVFIILTFLGFMGAIFTLVAELFIVAPFVFLVPLGLTIYYWRRKKALSAIDLLNDFRTCLRPALLDLAQDLAPGEKVKVRLDLSAAAESKLKSKKDLPTHYMKLTESIYDDPWGEVTLPLADGSEATIEFSNCYRRYDRRYRGRRGKVKSKTKWRKECQATTTLCPSAAGAFDPQRLQSVVNPQLEKAKLSDKGGKPEARLVRYWVFKGASDLPSTAPSGKEVVGMLLRLCTSWKPASGVAQ